VDLYEYEAKGLLAAAGLTVPRSRLTHSVAEAEHLAAEVGFPLVAKAQVLTGGRGKAGGVRLVNLPAELHAATSEILAMTIAGRPVVAVLLEEAVEIAAELYLAITLERSERCPLLLFSCRGGVEIEQVVADDPSALQRCSIDPLLGLCDYQVRALAKRAGLERGHWSALGEAAQRLWRAYQTNDAALIELNPLCLTKKGSLVALDAKISIDGNALYRQPDIARLPRKVDEREQQAKDAGFTYVALDGEIGVLGNGAGLVMSLLDAIATAGGRAANFLDVGGGAEGKRIAEALGVVLSDERVGVLLVTIFGGITRCDEVARGLLAALAESARQLPVVVSLSGTNAGEAFDLLAASGRPNLHVAADIPAAVAQAVGLSRAERATTTVGRG
jgi:succinyl-CoA synthetase beta subunit